MTETRKKPIPAAVYLVADHLDAMLAAGEDLLVAWRANGQASADVRLVPIGSSSMPCARWK
jgi:hypothetical protein